MLFPISVWFGVAAAILFLATLLTVTIKNLVKPKRRVTIHRTLALLGTISALVHIALALRLYL